MKKGLCALMFAAFITAGSLAEETSPYPTNATLNWLLPLNTKCIVSPAVGPDGTVYVLESTCGGRLSAFNPDMSVKWQTNFCSFYQGALLVGLDGTLYAAGQDPTNDVLCAVDPANGNRIWACPLGPPGSLVGGAALGADGTVYVCYLSRLFAITNGSVKWTNDAGGNLFQSASPAVAADGTIYLCTGGAKLYAINPDGTSKWIANAPGSTFSAYPSSPVIGSDGTIYYGVEGHFFAVNPDGTFKWTNSIPGSEFIFGAEIGPDGTILAYTDAVTNALYAFNPDGSVKWTFPMSAAVPYVDWNKASACALADDGQIYVSDANGKLYSLAPNGTTNWSYATGTGGLKSPVLGPEGTIYVVSYEQPYLYSFAGVAPLACGAWPEHRKNSRNTAAVAAAQIGAPAMAGDGFRFTASGISNMSACICASTNFVNWTNIGSVILTNGAATFTDTAASNFPSRFYRALSQ